MIEPAAVVDGGPLDGTELYVTGETEELVVTMADGSRHRYQRVPSPGDTVSFRWSGRV